MPSHPSRPARRRPLVVFEVAGQPFALPCTSVEEVLPMVLLAPPVDCPAWVEGWLELEGALVPVHGAARLLGLPSGDGGLEAHLLLLRAAEGRVALRVDRVHEVLPLEASALRTYAGGAAGSRRAEGLFEWRQRACILLCPEALGGRAPAEPAPLPAGPTAAGSP